MYAVDTIKILNYKGRIINIIKEYYDCYYLQDIDYITIHYILLFEL